jgi:hypothetical protein
MDAVRAVLTVVLIGAFAAFVAFLLNHVAADATSWERYLYLLTGVEAIVFAAVGWLFGREVNRARAESAEGQVKEVVGERVVAERRSAAEEERGRGLARAIVAQASTSVDPKSLQAFGAPDPEASVGDLSGLVRLAAATYPEVLA